MDPIEHIMQFFAHAHLPPHLAAISAPFGKLADDIIATCPRNPERTVALRAEMTPLSGASNRVFLSRTSCALKAALADSTLALAVCSAVRYWLIC